MVFYAIFLVGSGGTLLEKDAVLAKAEGMAPNIPVRLLLRCISQRGVEVQQALPSSQVFYRHHPTAVPGG